MSNEPMSDKDGGRGDEEPPMLEDDDFESTGAPAPTGSLWLKIAFGVVVSIALVTGVMYVKGLGPFAFVHENTPFDDDNSDALPAPSALPLKQNALPDPKPVEASLAPAEPTGGSAPSAVSEPEKAAAEKPVDKPSKKKAATTKKPAKKTDKKAAKKKKR